jgi:hypothetical protein
MERGIIPPKRAMLFPWIMARKTVKATPTQLKSRPASRLKERRSKVSRAYCPALMSRVLRRCYPRR